VADPAQRATRLRHNCSGKHALGLALCLESGWPTAGYLHADHPLQAAMREEVTAAAGIDPETVEEATDGCGMRTFRLPLAALARAFSRLCSGRLGPEGDRVAAAMRTHPHLVAFPGAIDTELMAAEPGLVAKVGAEGVIGIGLADGRALALKVRDGAPRAVDPAAVMAARELLGLRAAGRALDRLSAGAIANSRGEQVGRLEADLG
jgi:L-asparaginase II